MISNVFNSICPTLKVDLTETAPKGFGVLQRKVSWLPVPVIQTIRADRIPGSTCVVIGSSKLLQVDAVNVITEVIFASKTASVRRAVETLFNIEMCFEMRYSRIKEATEGAVLGCNGWRTVWHTHPHLGKMCCFMSLPVVIVLEGLSAAKSASKALGRNVCLGWYGGRRGADETQGLRQTFSFAARLALRFGCLQAECRVESNVFRPVILMTSNADGRARHGKPDSDSRVPS